MYHIVVLSPENAEVCFWLSSGAEIPVAKAGFYRPVSGIIFLTMGKYSLFFI
jgi:hypothetical protein